MGPEGVSAAAFAAFGRVFGLVLGSRVPLGKPLAPAGEAVSPDVIFSETAFGDPRLAPPDRTPDYSSPYRDAAGESVLHVFRSPSGDLLRLPGRSRFLVGEREILGAARDPAARHDLEIPLFSTILGYFLERCGVLALHASAASAPAGAIAFLSGKEAGKTTLAIGLARAGAPLLTDDLLPVEETAGGLRARPGYPALRLWPDQVRALLPGAGDCPLVHPAFPKRQVPAALLGPESFCAEPRPLARIYLPRREEGRDAVVIEPVAPADAVMELVRHSILAPLVEGLGWQGRRLAVLARVVRETPVRRLLHPWGHDRLEEIAAAVLADG